MSQLEPTREARRQAAQLRLLHGGEFEVGRAVDCPLPPAQLAALRGDEECVVQRFDGGLTARVLRLRLAGSDWTLKLARHPPRVHNVDGQTSFLNELQRRADLQRLKAEGHAGLQGIVDTTYGSLRHGVLLSPWIEGEPIERWDERRLAQLIDSAVACHAAGLFEWDLSPGNVLDDGRQIWLFDFGYMYRFDPLTQFNSAGNGHEMPGFHPVERFESRNFFGHLLGLGAREGPAAVQALYRLEKAVAARAYRALHAALAARGADARVLDWLQGLVARWERALAGDLEGLYIQEAWRSHVHDLDDDLRGRSCTPMTLARADWLLHALRERHAELADAGALFGDDAGLPLDALLARYQARRRQAQAWQVAGG